MADESEPKKRGRGRPPKDGTKAAAPVPPKKMVSPKRPAEPASPSPSSSKEEGPSEPKRGRGRPKKGVNKKAKSKSPKKAESKSTGGRRGRGRPKKEQTQAKATDSSGDEN